MNTLPQPPKRPADTPAVPATTIVIFLTLDWSSWQVDRSVADRAVFFRPGRADSQDSLDKTLLANTRAEIYI